MCSLLEQLRALQPVHAFGFGVLAADGVVYAGADIGAGVFARAAQGKLFAFGAYGFTNSLSVECHAHFHFVLRPVDG